MGAMSSPSTWRPLVAGVLVAIAAATLVSVSTPARSRASSQDATAPPNVLLIVLDDVRWDSLGTAGHPVVVTPHLDALAADGVRFTQARVTTSICMVSRASILTGQYMSRHGITAFGRPLAPDAFAQSVPGVLRRHGYWTAHVGKYGIGAPRPDDFDFLRAYERDHWLTRDDGTRVHVTEQNTRDALDALAARPSDRPFLLMLNFFAPHAEDNAPEQYLPQPESAPAYDGTAMPPPLRGDPRYLAALPPFLSADVNEGRRRFFKRFDTPARYDDYLRRYFRLLTEVDAGIGRVMATLRAQGVADRTLVVVIGDNGYFQGDRGLADKWYPYEESIRVPLIVVDPRLPAHRRGATPEALVLNIDVAPSVLAATGHAAPSGMQGRDYGPLYLSSDAPPWREEFFYEHPVVLGPDRIPASEAVVRRDWKYVEWPDHGHRQLFDLARDPGELTNLAEAPTHAARRADFAARLEVWRTTVR